MKAALWAILTVMTVLPAASHAQTRSDEWLTRPVDNATFDVFRSFFTYDRAKPFGTRVLDTAVVMGIRTEHLTFESTPGSPVFARLYEPSALRGRPSRAVLILHGGVARGKDNVTVLADFLAKSGWRVLAIDLPHFGERKTELLTTFTEAEKHENLYNQEGTYLAWVTQTVKDVSRSLDFLVAERNAEPQRIALVGYSRGAQLSMIAGASEKRFAAVALLYGGHLDAKETGHLAAACGANYIGRISPRPLFFLNGTQDADYDKATQVEPLQRLAGQPKEIVWVETGHIFPQPEMRRVLADWLAQQMP